MSTQTRSTHGVGLRRARLEVLFGVGLALSVPLVQAQAYPTKPVQVVVGSPPGALGDVLARMTARKLNEQLGQAFVVENRPGAALAIAAEAVARSAPDGYTLLVAPDSAVVVNQFIYSKLPYDPTKDFQSVGLLGKASVVLVVSPALGVTNVNDFIGLVKSKPGKIDFGSGGIGHPTHMLMELFRTRLGLDVNHVAYRGTTPALQDIASGQVGTMIVGIAESIQLIKAGRLVALAASGPQAKEVFPQLPLMTQLHKDLDLSVWFGVFAPAATPKDRVALLNAEVNKMLVQSDVVKQFSGFGMVPQPGPASELDRLMETDRARFGPLVKALGIKAD